MTVVRKAPRWDRWQAAWCLSGLAMLSVESGSDLRTGFARAEEAVDLNQPDQLQLALLQAEEQQLARAVNSRWNLSLLLSAGARC